MRIICTDKKGCFCIVALVSDGDEEDTYTYDSNGTRQLPLDSDRELVFASIKHEGWVNIFTYTTSTMRTDGNVFGSYEEARDSAENNPCAKYYVATVKVEWEE